ALDLNGRVDLSSGLLEVTSTAPTSGGITIGGGAVLDLGGSRTELGGDPIDSNGGKVQFTARSGDVTLATASTVDVSASGTASAGAVTVHAVAGQLIVAGTLLATADKETAGGSFSAEAQSLGDFGALNRTLNAGGFTGERNFEQRGSGDLVVAADAAAAVVGTQVTLVADQGRVIVDGTVRAHDVAGGRILLSARDGIAIGGSVDARGVDATERNGRIDLQSAGGDITVSTGAVVATSTSGARAGSAADGSVRIRQSQDALLTLLDADAGNDGVALAGDWTHAGPVAVEGFRTYDAATGSIGAGDVVADLANPYYADAATFAGQASAIAAVLESGTHGDVDVVAGVEIRSSGDLSLDAAWDLSQWHFADQPGVLTLRAAGDLLFNASLSDGFTGVTGTNAFLLTSTASSWSYRLAAGANLASADVLATRTLQELPAGTGNLRIAAGNPAASNGYTMIRTGTGSIDIAAAANVELGNAASMIYTSGIAASGISFNGRFGSELGGRLYPGNGGDIRIAAGQDVVGAASTQLVTDWLWRIGGTTRATAWTVNFSRFQQNVGALGGGDVAVTAGRDIDTLSIATPTIGRQTGGLTPDLSQLEITGGGDILAVAGRDLLGGTFYGGRGTVELLADGRIATSSQTALNPILALGDARATLHARQDVSLETVVSPTWLPQAIQGSAALGRSAFSTYTEDTGVRLESTAGNIDIGLTDSDGGQLRSVLSTLDFSANGADVALTVLPPALSAAALRGNIDLSGLVTLFPSSLGTLDLRAHDNVSFAGGGTVIVSDVDPAVLPSITTPVPNLAAVASALNTIDSGNVDFNADVPVRQQSASTGALESSRIVAETGDVTRVAGYFAGPLEINAGRDIRDPNVVIQNLVASDVSSLVAGRDIVYSVGRTADGAIAVNTAEIAVDGPGQLSLVAGRNVNLQNSAGISTRGNLVNSGLADTGAGISVLVGLGGQQPDYASFIDKYLRAGTGYDAVLSAYLLQSVGVHAATRDEAVDRFVQLDEKLQAALLERLLLAELRASAETAADPDPVKNGDYSRGFAALEALFPGIGSATGGTANRYRGDLALYFSRIYSQDGGDITLLAPGGGVNAGLATPPSAFGVGKAPDRLGIVTQRSGDIGIVTDTDLQVNESRIFAVDDSDILVWSSNGDIDAGRGAKTAISAPSPVITYDRDGRATVTYTAALAGSGIQTRATSAAAEPGAVVLAAPRGVVNA
ncbi:MAG: filamentous hemagglutinin family protein, partial [Vicinamibacterales bacterium]